MKGSITPLGAADRSGVDQHRSKSPELMSFASTKILCMARRPSSISTAGGLVAGLALLALEAAGLGAGGASAGIESVGKLSALLSICRRAVWTSVSSG